MDRKTLKAVEVSNSFAMISGQKYSCFILKLQKQLQVRGSFSNSGILEGGGGEGGGRRTEEEGGGGRGVGLR